MKRSGFTLIELLIAVLLLALLSGGAALSFRRPLAQLRIDTALSAIRQFDADARAAAQVSGQPQLMVIDLRAGRLQRFDGETLGVLRRQVELPNLAWRVMVEGQPQIADSVLLDVTPNGWTRSYAIGAGDRHLAVAGLTGQFAELP